jgi:hypothetical protein
MTKYSFDTSIGENRIHFRMTSKFRTIVCVTRFVGIPMIRYTRIYGQSVDWQNFKRQATHSDMCEFKKEDSVVQRDLLRMLGI